MFAHLGGCYTHTHTHTYTHTSILAEQSMNDNVKSNVIFNMQDSSLPSCFVSASEQPSKSFDPREPSHFRFRV